MFHLNLIFLGTFVLLLRLLIPLESLFNYYYDYWEIQFSDPLSKVEEFDFIIVGSGSAGSVIAHELSKHNKVLLLEAGGTPLKIQTIPGFVSEFLHCPQTDWMYQTVPQKNSHFGQFLPNISKWPRGLGLGGTSNLHYTLYSHSHSLDYDLWADVTNDTQWSYNNLLKYFKKSLTYNGKFRQNGKHYGNGGNGINLNVESKPLELETLLPFALEAGRELGIEAVDDLNGPQRTGFGSVEYTQKNGARSGAFAAFIEPVMHRKNLVISRYSLATKIELDKTNRVIGVWILRHGKLKFVKAGKEVIVSAGAVESPKLLHLSGIGPLESLKSVQIPPRVILPVGENLVDHFSIYLPPIVLHENPTGSPLSTFIEHDFDPMAFYNYFTKGQGPLTMASPNNFAGFLSMTNETKNGVQWPDNQIVAVNLGVTPFVQSDLPLTLGWKKEESQCLWESVNGKSVLFLGSVLARPKSKGTIKLKDRNPMSRPLIDPNYLDDPRDLEILIKSVEFLVKLMETKSFQKLGAKMVNVQIPSCVQYKKLSKKYWECYIRQLGISGFHPAGSCRMGQMDDPTTVVDSSLRVLKTRGLRVADASIMPEIVNGNPNTAIFMIGEKVSHMIRHYWSQQYLVCPRDEVFWSQFSRQCFYSQLV